MLHFNLLINNLAKEIYEKCSLNLLALEKFF